MYFAFWNIYLIIPQESLSVFTKCSLLKKSLDPRLLIYPKANPAASFLANPDRDSGKLNIKVNQPRSPRDYNHILHVKLGKLFYSILFIHNLKFNFISCPNNFFYFMT